MSHKNAITCLVILAVPLAALLGGCPPSPSPESPEDAAQRLRADGSDAVGVATSLRDMYGKDAQGAAQILKDVGFDAVEVGMCLRDVFNQNAEGAAQILKDVGFDTPELGMCLRDVFGLSAEDAAPLLTSPGYDPVEVCTTMRDTMGFDAERAALVLTEIGWDVVEIGMCLRYTFNKSAEEAVQILRNLWPYDAMELGRCLRDAFSQSAEGAAQILKDLGFSLEDIYNVLIVLYNLDGVQIESIFAAIGYMEDEYLEITTFPTVQRFAPRLGFDRGASAWGYPMPADVYFNAMMTPTTDETTITWTTPWDGPPAGWYSHPTWGANWHLRRICARDECNNGMSNSFFQRIKDGEVPTYFKVISDRTRLNLGRLRIAYWWFYGFQYHCNDFAVGPDGAHHGDWENIVVTTNPTRDAIEAVTFAQHAGHYTRLPGGFYTYGERPMVFVGKIAHGSYHDRCKAPECSDALPGLECRYFGDFRNPTATDWWNTSASLVSLMNHAESWMSADAIGDLYELSGTDFIIGVYDNDGNLKPWRWGPHISYCTVQIFTCTEWNHTEAVGTHPTVYPLTWDMKHCDDSGCDESQEWHPTSLPNGEEE